MDKGTVSILLIKRFSVFYLKLLVYLQVENMKIVKAVSLVEMGNTEQNLFLV